MKAVKLKESFYFPYYYDKLKEDLYSTIQGKNAFMRYHTGFTYSSIVKNKQIHQVILKEIHRVQIKDISMKILEKDIAPFKIKKRVDFIKHLNKFRRFNKIENVEEFVTIFWLRRVENE